MPSISGLPTVLLKMIKGSQLNLFYATTKALGPPCSYQACRVKKYVTLLSVNRIIHGLKLLQRSSLLFMLILLANDVEINPGPVEITKTDYNNLKVLYLNVRSVKSYMSQVTIILNRKIAKSLYFKNWFTRAIMKLSAFARHG